MISSNDLRPGVTIEYRGGFWQVMEAMHVKPGKGSAIVQSKLKNVETDEVLKVTFRAGERLSSAAIEKVVMIYLFKDGDRYVLSAIEGNEQLESTAAAFGESIDLLLEGQEKLTVKKIGGRIIRVELPITVELCVVETAPDERGDTASGNRKPAKLETGAVITVPFHVRDGDRIRVDTRSREYAGRVDD